MLNGFTESMPRFYGSVTVGERGQVAIPAEARREQDINPGGKLLAFGENVGRRPHSHRTVARHMDNDKRIRIDAFHDAVQPLRPFALVEEGLHDTAFLTKFCTGFDRFQPYLMGEADGQPKTADWAAAICEKKKLKGKLFVNASVSRTLKLSGP